MKTRPLTTRVSARTALAFLWIAAWLPGCEDEEPPPAPKPTAAPSPAVAAAAAPVAGPAAAAAAPEQKKVEEQYFYTPIGKRDPFRAFYLDLIKGPALTPGTEGPAGPLETHELEQQKLIAIITGISTPRAMVVLPNGKGYVVKQGTRMGRNHGKVTSIRRNEVVVEEEYFDADQKRFVHKVYLRLRDQNEGLQQ